MLMWCRIFCTATAPKPTRLLRLTMQGRLPHARDVLMPDDGKANLRDQAMERVINR